MLAIYLFIFFGNAHVKFVIAGKAS